MVRFTYFVFFTVLISQMHQSKAELDFVFVFHSYSTAVTNSQSPSSGRLWWIPTSANQDMLFTLGSRRHSQLQKVRQALPQRTHLPTGCQRWPEQHQAELLSESQGGLLMAMGWTGKQTKFAVRLQKMCTLLQAACMHKGSPAILFIREYRVCLLHQRQPWLLCLAPGPHLHLTPHPPFCCLPALSQRQHQAPSSSSAQPGLMIPSLGKEASPPGQWPKVTERTIILRDWTEREANI